MESGWRKEEEEARKLATYSLRTCWRVEDNFSRLGTSPAHHVIKGLRSGEYKLLKYADL